MKLYYFDHLKIIFSKRAGNNKVECNNIYKNSIKIVLKFVNSIEIVLLRSSENNIFKKQAITFILTVQILFKIVLLYLNII